MTESTFDSTNNRKKRRVSLRLPDYDYSQSGAYFITICVNGHRCLFGDIVDETVQLHAAGLMVRRYWLEMPKKFPSLTNDEFVVMPNHVHGIVILGETAPNSGERDTDIRPTLWRIVQWFKTVTTNAYIQAVRSENWPTFDRRLWQSGYYEHVIRNDVDLRRVREYIINNPIKWSLDKYNPAKPRIDLGL